MIEKLKPCPFCGSKDLDFDNYNSIECRKCSGQVCLEYGKRKETIKAWNKRVTAESTDSERGTK